MKYCCFALAVFGCLAIHPLVAQTPCAAQLVPLKPTFLYCSNAAPVCVGSANGFGGHWVWGCPSTTESAPAYVPIPLMVNQPPLKTPTEMVIEAQRLRQLRLQNEIQQQQLDEMRRANAAREAGATPRPETAPSLPEPAPSTLLNYQTKDEWNGRFWKSMDAKSKRIDLRFGSYGDASKSDASVTDTALALDQFYATQENLPIPIRYALRVVEARSTGVSEDKIQKQILKLRALANK